MEKMKFLIVFLLYGIFTSCSGQIEKSNLSFLIQGNELKRENVLNNYIQLNFSNLIKGDGNIVLGFKGVNKKKLDIKIISVTKDLNKPKEYFVYGKSKIQNNINEFQGKIILNTIHELKNYSFGVDNQFSKKEISFQGIIIASYVFYENNCSNCGIYSGNFYSKWYLDKENQPKYNLIGFFKERYLNNAFIGVWTSYNSVERIKSNWGDFLPPECGDLNISSEGFLPNPRYLNYGWKDFDKAVRSSKGIAIFKDENWWK